MTLGSYAAVAVPPGANKRAVLDCAAIVDVYEVVPGK
jgi:hypothetical protein